MQIATDTRSVHPNFYLVPTDTGGTLTNTFSWFRQELVTLADKYFYVVPKNTGDICWQIVKYFYVVLTNIGDTGWQILLCGCDKYWWHLLTNTFMWLRQILATLAGKYFFVFNKYWWHLLTNTFVWFQRIPVALALHTAADQVAPCFRAILAWLKFSFRFSSWQDCAF